MQISVIPASREGLRADSDIVSRCTRSRRASRFLAGIVTTVSGSAALGVVIRAEGEEIPKIASAAEVDAYTIFAAVSSTVPSSSLCRTCCCLAARSVGCSTFKYWSVTSRSSSITSAVVGTVGSRGKSVSFKLQPREGRGGGLCTRQDVAS